MRELCLPEDMHHGLTGPKQPIRVRSCILTHNLLGFWLLITIDLPTLYIWRATADWVNPNRINTFILYFLSPNPNFSNPLFFARLYGVRGCSGWPADSRTTLDLRAPTGPSRARGSRFSRRLCLKRSDRSEKLIWPVCAGPRWWGSFAIRAC